MILRFCRRNVLKLFLSKANLQQPVSISSDVNHKFFVFLQLQNCKPYILSIEWDNFLTNEKKTFENLGMFALYKPDQAHHQGEAGVYTPKFSKKFSCQVQQQVTIILPTAKIVQQEFTIILHHRKYHLDVALNQTTIFRYIRCMIRSSRPKQFKA